MRALRAALAFSLVLSACARPKEAAEKRYPMKGVVASVNRALREAVVAHEDVPGFMPAMTMPFKVADDEVLAELQRGDEIAAVLVVGETRYRLEEVKLTRKAPPGLPPPPTPGAEPDAGELAPDVTLKNQDGETIRLSDYRGRSLAVTFVFTRCPLPDFCPRMAAHFAEVDAALSADPALKDRAHLLAVSFDPKFDTPEVLRAWGRRALRTGGFDRYELATGEGAEIKRLADFLSLEYEEEGGGFTHNLRTAVLDTEGKLFRLHRGNDWTPEMLLSDLRAALGAR